MFYDFFEGIHVDIQGTIQGHINQVGHSIIGVHQAENAPSFAYTIGLTHKLNHKELLIFGLPYQYATEILNSIVDIIKSGSPIGDGESLQKIANFPLVAMDVGQDISSQYAFQCYQYYSNRKSSTPSFMIIYWPDENGFFPWQSDFNPRLMAIQPKISPTC